LTFLSTVDTPPRTMVSVGSTVTLKHPVDDKHKDRLAYLGATPGARGTLISVNPYIVDFPDQPGFVARACELDLAHAHDPEHGVDDDYVPHEHKLSGGREDEKCRYSDEQLDQMFSMFDADNSGEVDHQEAELLLKSMGMNMSPETLAEWFDSVDKDHSGKISKDEFKAAIRGNHTEPDSRREAVTVFQLFDTMCGKEKATKKLTPESFYEQVKVLDQKATKDDIDMVFKYMAREGNAFIDVDDWIRVTDLMRDWPAVPKPVDFPRVAEQ